MENLYDNRLAAEGFKRFLASKDGQIQKEILFANILKRLELASVKNVCDAACGSGWLAGTLAQRGFKVAGFDSAKTLLDVARKDYPTLEFTLADAKKALPFAANRFDAVILNMAAHDLEDLAAAYRFLYDIAKPQGRLIQTMANPYYAFPVGVWKKSLLGRLLGQKPLLKLAAYHQQSFGPHRWQQQLSSYFYPFAQQLNLALKAGWQLVFFQDLKSERDSQKFDACYRLYRFPMLLLLEFEKPLK